MQIVTYVSVLVCKYHNTGYHIRDGTNQVEDKTEGPMGNTKHREIKIDNHCQW
jgi:hypothetical protein